MATRWDARTYDRSSGPQQAWGATVLARLSNVAADATVLDVGCGTGRVTQELLALVPEGRVLAIDASQDMVNVARGRLGDHAEIWRQDVLDLDLDEPVDAIVSTATLHYTCPRFAGEAEMGKAAGASAPLGLALDRCEHATHDNHVRAGANHRCSVDAA